MHIATEPHRPDPSVLAPAEQIVAQYERYDVSSHPLFVDLRARPLDLGTIWLLMINLQTGVSEQFIHWLAKTIDRVPDRRIASLLCKQLNDELGNGDFSQIHSVLLDRFVGALAEHGARAPDERSLKPGRDLQRAVTKLFTSDEPYEGVGALMVSEIFAKQMDKALADELRRPHMLPPEAMVWLSIHEVLEASHADDSGDLAQLVPSSGPELAAAWRGATVQWDLLWNFLDAVRALQADVREPTEVMRRPDASITDRTS
jgi:pyrroloquinoline quinone (PQQ) biosynthesis protein C